MKIDKSKLKMGLWYEDEDGNFIAYSGDTVDHPENVRSYHVSWPLEVREEVWFLNDGKREGKPDITWRTHIGGGNQNVLLAMANSGDYTLSEAIAVWANACERCMNVLAYKYLNGSDGYPEYSDEWKKCHTRCAYCREEDNENP